MNVGPQLAIVPIKLSFSITVTSSFGISLLVPALQFCFAGTSSGSVVVGVVVGVVAASVVSSVVVGVVVGSVVGSVEGSVVVGVLVVGSGAGSGSGAGEGAGVVTSSHLSWKRWNFSVTNFN